MLFIQLTFLIKRKIFLLANKNYINYGLFFLSKLIGGEARGAKGCTPHSMQPRMPPSCSCTLPFVCPLCVQSREGVGHHLQVWACAPVRLPPLRIHRGWGTACAHAASHSCTTPALKLGGGGGVTSWFTHVPSCMSPCVQSGGRVVPPLGLPLACPLGAQTGKAPLPFHTPPVCAPPLHRNPGRGAWVCVWPPVCIALLHATRGTLVPIPTWLLICVSPLHANWGRRGARCAASGIGCGPHTSPSCAGGGGGGKGGGFPFLHGPILATPSQSRAPPWFVRNWGDKKGGAGPPPIRAGSPCSVCMSPWPSVPRKGGTKGVVRTPSPFLHAPRPWLPPSCMWRMGYMGKPGGGGVHKVGAARQRGRCVCRPPPFAPPALHAANKACRKGGHQREGACTRRCGAATWGAAYKHRLHPPLRPHSLHAANRAHGKGGRKGGGWGGTPMGGQAKGEAQGRGLREHTNGRGAH